MDYLIILFACSIASGCFWAGYKLGRLYLKVIKWNRVEAKIISKEVLLREKYSTSRTVAYAPFIQYSYSVNGIVYIGSKVHLEELVGGHRGFRKLAAEKFVQNLGSQMMVYVNPKHPEQSVMNCSGGGIYLGLISVGFIAILGGVFYVL
jgi:Protein of unknown function (DUF3592)